MGLAAAAFNGHPSRRLKLIGVTGTNGKTTTATLLCDAMRAMGHGAGLISTVDYRIGDTTITSTHTTPDPIRLNAMLAAMVERDCEYCFMEVSSHAVMQERIAGLHFTGAAFTNITHEHLDYHGTFAAYIAAKKRFFDELPPEAFVVTNADDRNGRVMVQNTRAAVRTVSLRSPADYHCKIVEQHLDGMLLSIDGVELWVNFIGRFNAYNLVTVYAVLRELGVERDEALRIQSALTPVNGRFETVHSTRGITAIVDYAHTPDALQNVFDAIADIRRPGQKLFTVVGCGGDRDTAKRPVMARIAAQCSDFTILTSDNPRSEDPADIITQMKGGLDAGHRAVGIIDRREAITTAVAMAAPGDIILIAGKGHETYQITGSEKRHFDDREEVRKAFLNFDL
jgi:UDP-N-acetylmuramoyl-L-alanyl-D-glutamate--2,6-diaminopimelate ligase